MVGANLLPEQLNIYSYPPQLPLSGHSDSPYARLCRHGQKGPEAGRGQTRGRPEVGMRQA